MVGFLSFLVVGCLGGVVDLVGLGCFLGCGIRFLQVCVCSVWFAVTCGWVLWWIW